MWTPLKNSLPGLLKARTVAITRFGSNLFRVHKVLLSTAHYCYYQEESLISTTVMNSFSAHFVSSPVAGPPSSFRFWAAAQVTWSPIPKETKSKTQNCARSLANFHCILEGDNSLFSYLLPKCFSFFSTSKGSCLLFQVEALRALTILLS